MTQRTVIIMDSAYYVVAAHSMTGNTVCIGSDRGVTKTVIYVMRRVTIMICALLLGMTISTDGCAAVQNHTGYRSFRCIFMLTICLYIAMTGITAVIVMQRVDRGPVGNRMTVTATRTGKGLVDTAVITYRMVAQSAVDMIVKVSGGMTIGTGRIS